jgi:8-oxo-dGTP pyrophosphatase MutT (NUDIX family)
VPDWTIARIADALREHVPAPVGKYRYFSVLIPLVEQDGELHVLYEIRADELHVQPGEVSFPGGGIEAGESPRDAAARETVEELCVPETAVTVFAALNYIVTYSNFTLYSFLGTIDADALRRSAASKAEVKETFLVPLNWLLQNEPEVYVNRVVPEIAPDMPLEKLRKWGGETWRVGESTVPVYTWADARTGEERVIWGMTARLTQEFVRLLREKT